MSLTVLSVAYPFAPVTPDTTGGAEQVLAALDRALVRAGHRSIVVARADSRIAGTLVPVASADGEIDARARWIACGLHREAIADALRRWPVDVVHMHAWDFPIYLPDGATPTLATLHLPIGSYSRDALPPSRRATWLNCVSASQHATFPVLANLLPPIDNGVDLRLFNGSHVKRGFALMLCRIAPEKGVHLAIEAAKRAGVPLLIAGEVFPYAEHRRYFETEIEPRLDWSRRYIGPVGLAHKRRLLGAAQCVVVASQAMETSSLVAREAAAAGTAVVAFARGALAETVEHGRTGFLVDSVRGMAEAISNVRAIAPEACRRTARNRFSVATMAAKYMQLYAQLSAWSPTDLTGL